MLQFNTDSWHYRLVMYVFGENFFTEKDNLDFDASEKTGTLVWTRKPKVVNFCPYCRGVLWSTLSLPFVFVWRLFPHKERKEMTHEEVMKRLKRRGFIIRCIGSSVLFFIGIINLLLGEYWVGITDLIIGAALIFTFGVLPNYPKQVNKFLLSPMKKCMVPIFKPLVNFIRNHWPKKKQTTKKEMPKNPSLLKAYLETNHSKICPPIAFIDPNDTKVRV